MKFELLFTDDYELDSINLGILRAYYTDTFYNNEIYYNELYVSHTTIYRDHASIIWNSCILFLNPLTKINATNTSLLQEVKNYHYKILRKFCIINSLRREKKYKIF